MQVLLVVITGLLTLILAFDVFIFAKYKTMKVWNSCLISMALAGDIAARLSQCILMLAPWFQRHTHKTTLNNIQESFRDTTTYLMMIISTALIVQWLWLYIALNHPTQLQELSDKSFFGKLTITAVLFLTVLIVNDYISLLVVDPDDDLNEYRRIIFCLFSASALVLISAYLVLYFLFIKMMKMREELAFMKIRVHSFYPFMIVLQTLRAVVKIIQTIEFKRSQASSWDLEYINVASEVVVNFVIVYYFTKVGSNQEQIVRSVSVAENTLTNNFTIQHQSTLLEQPQANTINGRTDSEVNLDTESEIEDQEEERILQLRRSQLLKQQFNSQINGTGSFAYDLKRSIAVE